MNLPHTTLSTAVPSRTTRQRSSGPLRRSHQNATAALSGIDSDVAMIDGDRTHSGPIVVTMPDSDVGVLLGYDASRRVSRHTAHPCRSCATVTRLPSLRYRAPSSWRSVHPSFAAAAAGEQLVSGVS